MFGHFSERGGGGLPNSKVFEELFSLILEIYQEEGGGYLIPKLLRNISACVWKFFRRGGGGLPDSKDEEGHFCFGLDNFQFEFWWMTKVQTL